MRASCSAPIGIRNDVVQIDFVPLGERIVVTICSAFLISVLETSISLSTVSKKSHWLFQRTTSQAPEDFFFSLKDEFYFISTPSCCPFVKGTVPTLGAWGFPRTTWLYPSCRPMRGRTASCFSAKPSPSDMIRGRCRQLTEITL